MHCNKCSSEAPWWKPSPDTHHSYRVECKSCGSLLKWGNEKQFHADLASKNGSALFVKEPDLEIDVSDLWQPS